MTTKPRKTKLWMGALLALVGVGAFTGISQGLVAQRAEDNGGVDVVAPGPATTVTTPAPAGPSLDVSGPCDEAEHAADPRCTGATTVAGDDRSGRSGSGSGRSGEDRSGPGRPGDDHSGSGRSGSDD